MATKAIEKAKALDQRLRNLRVLFVLASAWWVLLVLFHDIPALDINVQSFFFAKAHCGAGIAANSICGSFPFSASSFWIEIRWIFYWIPPVLNLALLGYVVFHWRETDNPVVKDHVHQVLLTIFAWILSVGFLVNFILKSHSGRPRPVNTDLFGGAEHFLPAGGFGGTCQSNCSFISGEGASAGWLICLIPLLPPALRPVLGGSLIVISVATPLLRVAFGGHYPSDALLGWLVSPIVFLTLVCLFGWTAQKN